MKSASCHPDRQHWAHGLCRNCYKIKQYRENTKYRTADLKRSADRYKNNPEPAKSRSTLYYHENKERVKNLFLIRTYGISLQEYEDAVTRQEEKCAICKMIARPRLYIDHNHTTGKVRALLCKHCNLAIGQMREDVARLREAADYLESFL